MKNNITKILTLILLIYATGVNAQCIEEQVLTNGNSGPNIGSSLGQQFVACETGILNQIELNIFSVTSSSTMKIEIYNSATGWSNLMWQVDNIPINSSGNIIIDLTTGSGTSLNIVKNQTYSMRIWNTGNGSFHLGTQGSATDSYTNGFSLNHFGNIVNWTNIFQDYYFRIGINNASSNPDCMEEQLLTNSLARVNIGYSLGQQFVACKTGTLNQIELSIQRINSSRTMKIEIYNSGTGYSNLMWQVDNIPINSAGNIIIDLTTGSGTSLNVVKNQTYSIRIWNTGNKPFTLELQGSTTDSYTNGFILSHNGTFIHGGARFLDFYFRIGINNATQSIPPSVTIAGDFNITTGEYGEQTYTANASGGVPPYTYEWCLNGSCFNSGTNNSAGYTIFPNGNSNWTLQVTVTDANGDTTTSSRTIIVEQNLPPPSKIKLDNSKDKNIKLVPNPTSNYFSLINTNLDYKEVSVLDFKGDVIKQFKRNDRYYIGNLPKGLYFIQIRHQKTHQILKLLKQ